MQRISISYFYGLAAALSQLAKVEAGQTLLDAWPVLSAASVNLGGLFGTDWFLPAVKSANLPGTRLLNAIGEITKETDFSKTVGFMEIYAVKNALSEFETVLKAELQMADCYFVTRKAGYDTTSLIFSPEAIFPPDLGQKVPSAIPDIREAGKCLAYEVSTAAGFHVLRATEAVLRRYWECVSGGKPHPKQKNLGVYLKRMEESNFGSAKVRAVLRQIKDLHRNPLMHPEETLNLQQASSLFGISQSAIAAMLDSIPMPPALSAVPMASFNP